MLKQNYLHDFPLSFTITLRTLSAGVVHVCAFCTLLFSFSFILFHIDIVIAL